MDAVEPRWRQLGVVLVEAGLLGEHDLLAALAEQERSGRRLGEILVARGLLSGPALANALAEQHGRVLRTEHGFGTGLRGLIGADTRQLSETGAAETALAGERDPDALRSTLPSAINRAGAPAVAVSSADCNADSQPEAGGASDLPQREHWAAVQAQPAPPAEGGTDLRRERVTRERRQHDRPAFEADAGRAAAAPSGAVPADEGQPSSDEQTDLPTPLEIPRDEKPALLGAPGAGSRQAENESAPEPQQAQDGEGQAIPQHLLFLPSARGYLLLRRIGEAPAVGQELELPELPGCRLLVSKRARSPLPLDSRVCVYLQPT
jgi:hypothetical protein